jgi:hypothetical protein
MARKTADPFGRGMGAKDDFIVEQFVPGEQYKEQQAAMVQKFIAADLTSEQIATMFLVPLDLLPGENPKDQSLNDL